MPAARATGLWSGLIAFLLMPCSGLAAEAEIHRCLQEDGTVAFQEMPCPDPARDAEEDDRTESEPSTVAEVPFDVVNPLDEAENEIVPAQTAPPLQEGLAPAERAECVKRTRDAIDAIDLEMRKGFSKEEGEQYLSELLELTRQLRACKQP